MRAIAIVVCLSAASCAAAAPRRPAPTAEEIVACTPDAMSLCVPHTGLDRAAIFNCLRSNKPSLRPACRAVFDKHRL